jgi:hypothetical protein
MSRERSATASLKDWPCAYNLLSKRTAALRSGYDVHNTTFDAHHAHIFHVSTTRADVKLEQAVSGECLGLDSRNQYKMWQDRRPNPPSPASRSGTNSPLPRRPTNSGPGPLPPRPGLNPRSSSLSLASTPTASFTNVVATLKPAHASSLRHELRADAQQPTVDPLKTLQEILGTSIPQTTSRNGVVYENGEQPGGLDESIDFQGLSLEEFVANGSAKTHHSSISRLRIQPEQCMCCTRNSVL